MSALTRENNIAVIAVATTVALLVTGQLPVISRPIQTLWSRLYLKIVSTASRRTKGRGDAKVTGLFTYPVKSLRAVSTTSAAINERGLAGDRCYMLVVPTPKPLWGEDSPNVPTYRFLSQRQCPSLARISADLSENELVFSTDTDKRETMTLSTHPQPDAPVVRCTVWGDVVTARDMGDSAATFFQSIVDCDDEIPDEMKGTARLVVQLADDNRRANDALVPAAARSLLGRSPLVSLADGFPILIASQASLDELNRRLATKGKEALPMARFRPNIVIEGTKAFQEDRMKTIAIGDHLFHVVSSCPRCKESCTDQTTGKVTEEPVETLKEFRNFTSEGVYFAVNAIPAPESVGKVIKIGDPVHVIEYGEAIWGDP